MTHMKLALGGVAVVCTLLGFSLPVQAAGDLAISQVYGGGGNTGAPLTHDFIEIFNRGAASASLNGLSLQYTSATGTGNFGASDTLLTELPNVTLQPGQYFLVQEAGGAIGSPLPTPDVMDATPIAMAAGAGKVALVTGITTLGCNGGSTLCDAAALARILDLVGYGTANFFEGAAAAPLLSNTTAALRNGNGCTDTDNNGADFTAGAPAPRNTASTLNACGGGDVAPSVATTTPANGATGVAVDANLTITFSEPVNAAGSWFDITCAGSGNHGAAVSGGPTTFTLNPGVDFGAGESCTVTVLAAQVTDQDPNDPPDAMAANHLFTFQTAAACGSAATRVHQVQGVGPASPMQGQAVAVEGVVVGDFQGGTRLNGFFMQEEDADADSDPLTSEGILVNSNIAVALGDRVRVSGTVAESFAMTTLTSVSAVTICAPGPAPTPAAVTLPFATLTDAERYEGMAVVLPQVLTVSETFGLGRFGEVVLSSGGRLLNPTNVVAPGAPAQAMQAANDLNRIVLDDGSNVQNPDPTPFMFDEPNTPAADPTLRGGDTVSALSGVMHFAFSTYRIQPVVAPSFAAANPRPTGAPSVGGTLKVAAANVLNYFNGDGEGGGFPTSRGASTPIEFQRQRAKTIASLTTLNADVVGLMELENDSTASEYSAIEDLVDGLNAAAGAGTYEFVDTDVIGPDEIRVAVLYKPAAVTPIGTTGVLTTGTFDGLSRPPVAQAFRENATGAEFIVVVNHFKSKSCGGATGGDVDSGDGQACYNATRVQSANELLAWLATDPTATADSDVVILGDLNSYLQENPIAALEAGGFENLVESWIGTGAYSFAFQGQAGALDNAMASASLDPTVTGVAEWHTNADEPNVLDYNMEFKSPAQNALEPGTIYRAADHDLLAIGLEFSNDHRLQNGSMDQDANDDGVPDAWMGTNLVIHPRHDGQDCEVSYAGCSFRVSTVHRSGLPRPKQLAQTRPAAGTAGDVFHLGYWVKAELVRPWLSGRARVIFRTAGRKSSTIERSLPSGTQDWTHETLDAVAPHDYTSVRVEFFYARLAGTIWIDEVELTRE